MASSMATSTEQVKGQPTAQGRLLAGEFGDGRALATFAERSYTEFKVAMFYFSEGGDNVLTADNLIKVSLLATLYRPCACAN